MKVKYKIWMENEGKVLFGVGRGDLLKAVDEEKSLSGAAKKLGMSYRAAWGRLKASQERMGVELVESRPGERSMQLTPRARDLISCFDRIEEDVERIMAEAQQELLSLLKDRD